MQKKRQEWEKATVPRKGDVDERDWPGHSDSNESGWLQRPCQSTYQRLRGMDFCLAEVCRTPVPSCEMGFLVSSSFGFGRSKDAASPATSVLKRERRIKALRSPGGEAQASLKRGAHCR